MCARMYACGECAHMCECVVCAHARMYVCACVRLCTSVCVGGMYAQLFLCYCD